MAQIKTLLLTGGIIHDWQGCGDVIESILQGVNELNLTRVNDDLSVLEAPNLDAYDLLVFYWTRGELTDAQKNGLLNWVASGKSFVGVHSATASFWDCPEYRAMLGGYFTTHPKPRPYQVSVRDDQHPITKDMIEFTVKDEMYIMNYDPRVDILAATLWKAQIVPVVWTTSWGEGKVYYLALGHDPEACSDENFKTLLVRGCLWAASQPANRTE